MCTSPVKIAKEYHMCTCQKSLTVKLGHENNYVLINRLINYQLSFISPQPCAFASYDEIMMYQFFNYAILCTLWSRLEIYFLCLYLSIGHCGNL